jgi:hypothetical protein
MRWAAIGLCLLIGCKKQEEPPPPAPTTPSVGHARIKPLPGEEEQGSGSGSAVAHAPGDAGGTADAPMYGGNGKPAGRDANGRVRGPGGPLFMGHGPECTEKTDHCLREGTWFAVGNVQKGKLFRATPVFEFEDKWWKFDGAEIDNFETAFKTKIVEKPEELKAGSPVIWLIDDNSHRKWVNSEHDAATTSRWEAGVIERVSGATFTVYGWPGAIPNETARVIVQQKKRS